jgi:hypothetical protein
MALQLVTPLHVHVYLPLHLDAYTDTLILNRQVVSNLHKIITALQVDDDGRETAASAS